MADQVKHIVFLGFKHVGKSVIGRAVAAKLAKQFIDLDEQIENLYAREFLEQLSCRQISQRQGESFFRDLETKALQQTISLQPAVIALGGGAPLRQENQALLSNHLLVYITAAQEIVYARIMASGIPSFFSQEDPEGSFKRLWSEREIIYKKLATFIVDNSGDVQIAVKQVLEKLRN